MRSPRIGLRKHLAVATAAARASVSRQIAELKVRLRQRAVSPRTLIARLGVIVACLTIVAPPMIYAWVAANQLRQRAFEQASVGARHVEVQLTKQETIDWLTQVSIDVLHATQGANSSVKASWVTDTTGRTLMFQGVSPWWPELTTRARIDAAKFQGYFHVAVSTREVFIGTFKAAVAFLILGLACYFCFHRLPLRALDRASERLEAKQQELVQQKLQVEIQNLRFDAALNNMTQGLCMFDGKHELVVCNSSYASMYNLPERLTRPGTLFRDVLERRIANGFHEGMSTESYTREVLDCMVDDRPVSKVRELSDGRVIAIKQRRMPDGGWISTHEDITEYRRVEARAAHLARYDALTDLPNRAHLREWLDEELTAARTNEKIVVLSFDIDGFKELNDSLGHAAGDALLRTVGERLRGCLGERDTIARLGGDEFAIVQVAAEKPGAETSLAAEILDVMALPFELNGEQVTVGASIGIAVSPSDGTQADELLKNADLALHRAKAEGRGSCRFFEAGMDADMQARCKLQVDLRKALTQGEFQLYYQPVVNLEHNQICGLEALLRWVHPERGIVSPGVFIPLAEETGLIVPIGEWALRQACADAALWPDHIKVAVNLSPVQFRNRNLVQMVFAALAASGLPASRLELEITESVLLHDNAATIATLHQLRSLGVRIAMDDFGTGYSSLSYLRSFPFDKIKIDRCFVKDLSDTNAGSVAILRAVANLGISLGMATTAEGVETEEQLGTVRAEGCTEMQGYFFSPPRPLADIQRLFLAPARQRSASAA
jgi:diguanylate cyclase (GGDEF)-like protein